MTPPGADAVSPAATTPPRLDRLGRYRARADFSYGVIAFYLLLLLLIGVFLQPPKTALWAALLLAIAVIGFLARYLSTHYVIDADYLRASRILGGQKVRLREVRRIEFVSLRELSATGFWGSWGWRGRMWSPRIGQFDCIHTTTNGILVTAGTHPLFVTPVDRAAFAEELSRRVRSHGAKLLADESAEAPAAPRPY